MNKKVIVFGATGHTASCVALDLKNAGYDVLAVGRRESDNGFFADFGIPYYSVDITDSNAFKTLPQGNVFAIVHYAGILPSHMDGYHPELYISSIVQGTFNVLEYARQVGAERFVFPQTLFDIHHLFGSKIPIPADAERRVPRGDHAMYVIAKNMAVDMIEHYYAEFGIKRFIFRMSRIYLYLPTPFQYQDGKKFLVSDRYMIYRAMKGLDIEMWGDRDRILETMCIRDLEQLIRCALTADCDGGIYNVGSGGTTLEERVRGIIEVFSPKDHPSKIIHCPDKPDGQQFVLDYSKGTIELGYRPKYKWIDYLLDFKKEMELQRFHKLQGYESDYFDLERWDGSLTL